MFLFKNCWNKMGFSIQRSSCCHCAEGKKKKKNRGIRRELQLIWKESLLIIWDEWAETQISIFNQYFGEVWALYFKGICNDVSSLHLFLMGSPLQTEDMNLWLEHILYSARFERRLYNPKFHIAADTLETKRIKSTFNEVLYRSAFWCWLWLCLASTWKNKGFH